MINVMVRRIMIGQVLWIKVGFYRQNLVAISVMGCTGGCSTVKERAPHHTSSSTLLFVLTFGSMEVEQVINSV